MYMYVHACYDVHVNHGTVHDRRKGEGERERERRGREREGTPLREERERRGEGREEREDEEPKETHQHTSAHLCSKVNAHSRIRRQVYMLL